jgi:hypothetical protein
MDEMIMAGSNCSEYKAKNPIFLAGFSEVSRSCANCQFHKGEACEKNLFKNIINIISIN